MIYVIRKVRPDHITEVEDSRWGSMEEALMRVDELVENPDPEDAKEFPKIRMGFVET